MGNTHEKQATHSRGPCLVSEEIICHYSNDIRCALVNSGGMALFEGNLYHVSGYYYLSCQNNDKKYFYDLRDRQFCTSDPEMKGNKGGELPS